MLIRLAVTTEGVRASWTIATDGVYTKGSSRREIITSSILRVQRFQYFGEGTIEGGTYFTPSATVGIVQRHERPINNKHGYTPCREAADLVRDTIIWPRSPHSQHEHVQHSPAPCVSTSPHLSAERLLTSGSLMSSVPAVGVRSPSGPSGRGSPASSSMSCRLIYPRTRGGGRVGGGCQRQFSRSMSHENR